MSSSSSRGNPSMGDIARSVGVLGAILLVLFALGRLLTVTPDEPVRPVDYRSAAESSRTVATFDLYAPESLPKGWRATSVRFEPDSWHLGVLTADDDYVGLEQVRDDTGRAVERFAKASRADGKAEIDGTTWSLRTGPRDDLTYVRRDSPESGTASGGGMTIVVTGSAPRAVMERYISSLSGS
ncbi:DUF4245 domain-containing protein [Aeromicrobium sp.]|uniref:DUF4245 domain-containing protein n=1 Tax=Aeromicrobium sp. TaxID=1871063 RepID=UPI003C61D648